MDFGGDFSPMLFKLHSEYQPTGDQPEAIAELVKGFKEGNQFQTLLGVTGSGKTFTMANIIQALQKPTLVIAHNKTLAGQLYGEFKEFFPENAVEYFVSYYIDGFRDTIYNVKMWKYTIYSMRMNGLELYGQHKFNTTVNRIRRKGSSKSNVVSKEINLVV